MPLDFRDQYFGCEIELTGINRATAAQTLADLFGTRAEHSGGGYDAYRVKDLDGKVWKIVRDSSIHPECRRRSVLIGETYKVELNSPKLEYGEMEKLQEVVRSLRRAGGIVNDSCGMPMKVLIVEPGKYPREADIEHTLEAEQAVVGGTIEAVYPWRDSACIVCNDNGIAENLPLNRMLGDYDIIHGTFFVCGLTRDDFTELTPQQMKHYEEMYHDPQLFFLLGKTLCVEHTTPEEYDRVMAPPPKTKESPER